MSENQKSLLVWCIVFVMVATVSVTLACTVPELADVERTVYKDQQVTASTQRTTSPKTTGKARIAVTEELPVNINTATKAELMEVPGIGETYAERIVAYREENGDFLSLDELTNVKGIGEKRLEKWAQYLTIHDK